MAEAVPNRREMLGTGVAGVAAALFVPGLVACGPKESAPMLKTMTRSAPPDYAARDFSGLVGTPGFSETLLKNHFQLYQGYVKSTNAVLGALAEMAKENTLATPAAAELRRRFGWEWDGMRLHELYFDNMGGKEKLDPETRLAKALAKDFGSYDAWSADFKAVGLQRGIGWAALVRDPVAGRLMNIWIDEHDSGHLAGCPIVLIMDVFEHAFMLDYGLKRADYVEAFFKTIHWANADKRM